MPGEEPRTLAAGDDGQGRTHAKLLFRAADSFIVGAAALYALAALAMATVSLGLITVSILRLYAAVGVLE
jgi:hypothetical protein